MANAGPWRRGKALASGPLRILMLGHFSVDMYAGVLPVLYPLLIGRFHLDLKTLGLVALAYSGGSSVSQPLFGLIADRWGTRFTGGALAWTAILFATVGFAPTFPALLALAGLAGIGSGAFHPMGAVTASVVIDEHNRNSAMSLYTSAGTLGVALGPLVGALVLAALGLHGTALMLAPGMIAAVLLLRVMRRPEFPSVRRRVGQASETGPLAVGVLAVIVGVMMLRSWTTFGLQSFIPTWYASLGYGPEFYGPLATTLVLTNAIGAVGAGALADRIGRKTVILASAICSVPTILVFAQFPGGSAFVTAAAIGLLGASTAPLLLVLAQQVMAGRAGLASGLILGLGFITGAIGIPILGAIGDRYGLQNAMRALAGVGAAGAVLSCWLPTEERVRQIVAQREMRPVASARAGTAD
jgi:FSR family fosmidomycin resistance protein-like MFS transporter